MKQKNPARRCQHRSGTRVETLERNLPSYYTTK
nr:MAG TPA: Espin, Myosin-IIIb myosin, complex, protein binding [Caudoviricetes sp.]